MIGFLYLFYNKYINFKFKINNEILSLLLCKVVFSIINYFVKVVRLKMLCTAR